MKLSGSHFKDMSKSTLSGSSSGANQSPRAGKNRLEDILNELISLEENSFSPSSTQDEKLQLDRQTPDSLKNENAEKAPPPQNAPTFSEALSSLPSEFARILNLPANCSGAFKTLKQFQQNNRHNPVIKLKDGSVLYLAYDMEIDRIRVFIGKQRSYSLKSRGLRISSGSFIIEEVIEFKLEVYSRNILGFSKSETQVLAKRRKGRELLTPREMEDASLEPMLYFLAFTERAAGISSYSVKAESI